jgi:hypothetical protein
MERHWKRIYQSIAWNELQDLRIRSFTHHGKFLSKNQQIRIDNRLNEMMPYYEEFIKRYGTDKFFETDTDKIAATFSEFVRECRKGEKIRKVMAGIKGK